MMPHTAILTVSRVTKTGDAFQCFTAVADGAQRVDHMVTLEGKFGVVPGEVYQITANAPPDLIRDRYGNLWHKWGHLLKAERISACGGFTRKALMRLAAVGEVRAKLLWDAYGSDVLQILLSPDEVENVAQALGGGASGRHAAATIHASAITLEAEDRLRQEEFDFHIWLEENGIDDIRVAGAAWRLLKGESAIERLRKQPYLLAGLIDWKHADSLGRGLLRMHGVEERLVAAHPDRLLGALDSVARSLLANGDSEIDAADLYRGLSSRGVPRPHGAAETALAPVGGQFIWTGEAFRPLAAAWLEQKIADRVQSIERGEGCEWRPPPDLVATIKGREFRSGITLTEEQRTAIGTLLKCDFGVLVGGAGTGKTFTMRVLVDVFAVNGGNVVMAALAGKAALTLAQATGRLARTITQTVGLLRKRQQFEADGRQVPEDWPHLDSRSMLLIDEASMVDTPTLAELLELVPRGCRILLVGDNGQLPPVGWGQVFHDLVARGRNVMRLTQIQRQRTGSGVALIAAAIREGHEPKQPVEEEYPGVSFIETSPGNTVYAVIEIADRLGGFNDESLMVCAARRNTVAEINSRFAFRAHTETNTMRLSAMCSVSAGDPVVCTRNRYGDATAGEMRNGMIGRVIDIFPDGNADHEEAFILVRWQGEEAPRRLTGEATADIELAYAITAHRAQGSGARHVIVPVEASPMITKQWLYTAVSRAKERVWLVGQWSKFRQGISRSTERSTGFWRLMRDGR